MGYSKITAKLERSEESVTLAISDTKRTFTAIMLTDDKTEDIKKLFEELFKYIIDNEKSISITYEKSEKSDIFDEVANEVIGEINKELKDSEGSITELLKLKNSAISTASAP